MALTKDSSINIDDYYKGVVENIRVGVSLISPKMEILALNRQMREWFPNVDVSSKPICYQAFNIPPRPEVCSYCPTCKTLTDGKVHESTTSTPRGEKTVNFRVVSSPLYDKEGKIVAAIELVEDITAEMAAKAGLEGALLLNKKILASSPVGIATFHHSGKCTSVNEAFARILDGTAEQIATADFHKEKIWQETGLLKLATMAVESETELRQEIYLKPTPDRAAWLDCTFTPFVMGGEKHFLLIIADQTARKQAEQTLRQSHGELEARVLQRTTQLSTLNADLQEALQEKDIINESLRAATSKLETIIKESPLPLITVDLQGVVRLWNPAAEKVFGYSYDEVCGSSNLLVLESADYPSFTLLDFLKLSDQQKTASEVTIRHKDGHKIITRIYGTVIRDKNGLFTEAVAVMEDVTKRREMQELLRKAKDSAERASKAKSEYLSYLTHDLRTPLFSIIGFSELLQNQLSQPKQLEYVSAISSSCESLLQLVNDLLDLAKIEAGKISLSYEPTDLVKLCQQAASLFELKFRLKNVAYQQEISPEKPPLIMIDQLRLRQILHNLIGNALKFTSTGYVRLSIACSPSANTPASDKPNNASSAPPDSKQETVDLVISVTDTGCGIPTQDLDNLFKAFEQGRYINSHSGGFGLGLAIIQKLTTLMGGTITVHSSPGHGTTFTIHLPEVKLAHSRPTYLRKTEPAEQPNFTFEPATIMVIDDDETNRKLIGQSLEKFPFRFIECDNVDEALAKLEKGFPDLILLDLIMPGKDGWEMARSLRELELGCGHTTPLIVLTTYPLTGSEEQLKKFHINKYLIRPIRMHQLVDALRDILPWRPTSGEEK